jgi:soluble lytic murein transglycosylase-like protein
MIQPDKDKVTLAEKAARLLNGVIEPDLILAVIYTESSGNPWAIRYEPAFYDRYVRDQVVLERLSPTEARARAMSWGLMQVMGQVARERGFKGEFLSELLEPWTGIWWGARHLAAKVKKYGLEGGISAYNHGQPYPDLAADPYLKKVLANLAAIKEARAA